MVMSQGSVNYRAKGNTFTALPSIAVLKILCCGGGRGKSFRAGRYSVPAESGHSQLNQGTSLLASYLYVNHIL